MKFPTLSEEQLLWKQPGLLVAGLDEAGRGPLAGPVVAAAVVLLPNSKSENRNSKWVAGVKNSKALTAKQRESVYAKLTAHKNIAYGVGIISEKIIDEINILQATKLAMVQALENLAITADYLLIDGNFTIDASRLRQGFGEPKQKTIIKGDEKVYSIAAASIIAKVTRDRLMQEYHQQYPGYGFDEHKGYGTPAHLANLTKLGPCDLHRRSFFPIRQV